MNKIIRNSLAVLIGLFLGSLANMGLVMVSGSVIPPPEGADNTTMEGLRASMHLFEAKHFIFPFLAHSVGTFVGAFITTLVAVNHSIKFAYVIGLFFFLGGLTNIILLPSPTWFTLLDLGLAYFPMAWLGGNFAQFVYKKEH